MYTIHKPLYLSAYDHPDIYPGPAPEKSYLYMNGSIYFLQGTKDLSTLSVVINRKRIKLNELLRKHGAASIEERYPILSYGSNACLAQLKHKYQSESKAGNLLINLRGEISETDVVYSSTITRYGAIPATLAPMKGAKCQVWLSLLDENQFKHMIQTEKPYSLALSTAKKLHLENGIRPSCYYAFLYNQVLSVEGSLFRYPDIPASESIAIQVWQAHMLMFISSLFKMEKKRFIQKVKTNDRFRGKVFKALQRFAKPVKWDDWQKVDKVLTWKESKN